MPGNSWRRRTPPSSRAGGVANPSKTPGLRAGRRLASTRLDDAGIHQQFPDPPYGPSPGVEHVVARLADAVLDAPNVARVRELGELIAEAVLDGRQVLVRCSGGLNRSGVVVAETLVELGRTPDEAVGAVRTARGPWALTNSGFVDYLGER